MKEWLAPLKLFVILQLGLLVVFILMPSVEDAAQTLKATTASYSSFAWGWNWLMTQGVVRLMVYVFYELAIAFAVGMVFLRSKV